MTQEPSIFRDLTVKENIDLALESSFSSKAIVRSRREKIINEFNLNRFVDNYGYQSEERGGGKLQSPCLAEKGPRFT